MALYFTYDLWRFKTAFFSGILTSQNILFSQFPCYTKHNSPVTGSWRCKPTDPVTASPVREIPGGENTNVERNQVTGRILREWECPPQKDRRVEYWE